MFTQQHYKEIAKILKDNNFPLSWPPRAVQARLVSDFVVLFEKDNPKFDVDKFLNTIYGKEEK